MIEDDGLHEPEPIEQSGHDPSPAQDDTAMPTSGETTNVTGSRGASNSLIDLIEDERLAAFWAIEDLAERARALDVRVPLACEDPEWVKLIRSVDDPAAGLLGAQLQDRIGSERPWEEGRQRWKRKMKEFRKSLTEEDENLKTFESLCLTLHNEGRLLLTKEEYHEKAIEDWFWDLDHSSDPAPTADEFARSKNRARESREKWLSEIRARNYDLHMMKVDYGLDGDDFGSYRHLNLALADRGDGKITRAEFWKIRGRSFDPTRLSLYRALLGDLALPAASLG